MATKKVLEENLRYEREMKNNFRDIIREQNLKLHDKGNEIESLKAQIGELKVELGDLKDRLLDVTSLRDSFYQEYQRERAKVEAYRDALKIVASGGE